ncbi:hypothetical protein ACR03S_15995 (plasmid) [Limimaricola variabilis]
MIARFIAGLWVDEDGSTIFSLFWTLVLMVLAGVAIDPVNAWRSKQFLKQTADVSAHAAVVALATGSEPTEMQNAVRRTVAVNLDADRVGEVLADPGRDIELLIYDPRSNTASPSNGGPANAALVRLRRSKEQDNAVPFTFLRVMTLFSDSEGMPGWEMTVEGVAAWVPTTRCRGSDMLIAGGEFHLSANNTFAAGYCVHAQDNVWMPQNNTFAPGSSVSMPDLADCKDKCKDKSNPGATQASNEMNLPVPELNLLIDRLEDAFIFEAQSPEKAAFFHGKSGLGSLLPLAEIGYPVNRLTLGAVVHLSRDDFQLLPVIPAGLVYDVSCDGRIAPLGRATQGKGGGKNKPSLPNPVNGSGKTVSLDAVNAASLRDIALITDCGISLGNKVDIAGSLLVSTGAGLSASSQSQIGASSGNCAPQDRTTVLVRGDIHIPGSFSGSNTSFMTTGDLHMAGGGNGGTHHGVSMMAQGDVHVSAGHDFVACATESVLQPQALMIRHVEPVIVR